MGMDSLMALDLRRRLEAALGLSLPATLAFDHPNVQAMTTDLARRLGWTPAAAIAASLPASAIDLGPDADIGALVDRELERLEALIRER
jgi:hypothetical protein